jgi:hypothetical protein
MIKKRGEGKKEGVKIGEKELLYLITCFLNLIPYTKLQQLL